VILAQAPQTVIDTPPIAWRALLPVLILLGGAIVILGTSSSSVRRRSRDVDRCPVSTRWQRS
jgi:hypothetical protein